MSGTVPTEFRLSTTGTVARRNSCAIWPSSGAYTIGLWPSRKRPNARSRTYVSVPVSEASVAFTIRTLSPSITAPLYVIVESGCQWQHMFTVTQHLLVVPRLHLFFPVRFVERYVIEGRHRGSVS